MFSGWQMPFTKWQPNGNHRNSRTKFGCLPNCTSLLMIESRQWLRAAWFKRLKAFHWNDFSVNAMCSWGRAHRSATRCHPFVSHSTGWRGSVTESVSNVRWQQTCEHYRALLSMASLCILVSLYLLITQRSSLELKFSYWFSNTEFYEQARRCLRKPLSCFQWEYNTNFV